MIACPAIDVKFLLAPTPKNDPQFAQDVQTQNGAKISVADPRATRAMVALMDMEAVLGGAASHWGGPSAFAELMSALHGLVFHESRTRQKAWYELFHLINDAGHCENGLYALKANYGFADLSLDSLKGFRSIHSKLTGHGESHLFPEAVLLSNGPLGSSLPQAQGLCLGDAWAKNSRITVATISDGACMEGEAREALAAIPGLARRGYMAPFVLIISDNNTKLSGRIDEESFSMQPTFASLSTLGWEVLELKEAHNLQACTQTLEQALNIAQKNPHKPVAVHAHTIKGYGVKSTEQSASGGHGFPLKDPKELRAFLQEIYQGEVVPQEFLKWTQELESKWEKKQISQTSDSSVHAPSVKKEKVQVGVTAALNLAREQGLPVVSISSDLPGSTGLAGFHKKHPEASLDVGVAESNMISTAAGLSKLGYIPVVDTFSQFGVTKGALPMIMASLSQAPIIAIFSHAGFQDAADGASHQALSYIAMTSAIPHTDVYCLTSSSEAKALVGQALQEFYELKKLGQVPRSKIFFLGREDFPQSFLPENTAYELGKAQVVFDNSPDFNTKVTLVAAGALLPQALKAAQLLESNKVGSIVVNPSIINHPDVDTLVECLEKSSGNLITIEDHQIKGGVGSLVIQALAMEKIPLNVTSLGVCDEFGQSAYKAEELYKKHGLDAEAIVQAAIKLSFPSNLG